MILFDQDDVAAALTGNAPAKSSEDADDVSPAEPWERGHSGDDLDFTGLDGQRQAALGTHFEAEGNSFLDVLAEPLAGFDPGSRSQESRGTR